MFFALLVDNLTQLACFLRVTVVTVSALVMMRLGFSESAETQRASHTDTSHCQCGLYSLLLNETGQNWDSSTRAATIWGKLLLKTIFNKELYYTAAFSQ